MLGNWIKQTTTTAGTGNLTLASVTGFDTFTNQMGDATTNTPYRFFKYVVQDGNNWELGLGHMSSTTVLVRDTPEVSLNAGVITRGGAALSLSGASATVFCDYTSEGAECPAVLNSTTNGVPFYRGGSVGGTITVSVNGTLCWAVYLLFGGLYAKIRHHCITAGGGTKFQWGIYQASSTGDVGNLIARTANITPGTGDISTAWSSASNVYFEKGWYWLVWSGDGAPAFNCRTIYGANNYGPAGVDTTGAGVYGEVATLSSPLPAAGPFASMIFQIGSRSTVPDMELIHA